MDNYMNLFNSQTYLDNLELARQDINYNKLFAKSFLITGSTGLIGSTIVDFLLFLNRYLNANCKIYAASRNIEKLNKRFGIHDSGISFITYDALQPITFNYTFDFIIHAAGNASPEKYVVDPIGTLLSNILGIHNLLEYSKNGSTKVMYISSSEVYGNHSKTDPIKETDYGKIDFNALRSSYPIGKQAAELLCLGYSKTLDIPTYIVRPGHIYGPTAQESDKRVSSLFVKKAIEGEDIILKSSGSQLRSYCYCIDCLTAIFTVLLNGDSGGAYNISNKKSIITIRQMAEIICNYTNVNLIFDLPSDMDKRAFNPMDNSSLNSDKLEAIGWTGRFDAETGFMNTIKILKEMKNFI